MARAYRVDRPSFFFYGAILKIGLEIGRRNTI